MLMKYNDFKKMSADEMKAVKGGQGLFSGRLVQCGTFTPFCISGLDAAENCGLDCVQIGNCPVNNDFC